MPKPNAKGGKKFKRGKKGGAAESDNYPIAEEGQMYAKIISNAGGSFLNVLCSDDKDRKAFIRGAFRKSVWMNPDDILLISTRDFEKEDTKCDIIYKYTPSQAKKLFNAGEIKFEVKEQQEADNTIWEQDGRIQATTDFDDKEEPFNFDEI